jgi:hypothetical protein
VQPAALENNHIEPEIGDGILFTKDIEGVAHRFFVDRATLSELERTRLIDNHDMVASFDRQSNKVHEAISQTLRLGTSPNITCLKLTYFN